MLNRTEKREYQEWLDLCERIKRQTAIIANENAAQKKARIEKLKGDFVLFCKYYFADTEIMDAEFAWFHLEAAKKIAKDPKIFCVLEWPREHAKSVFACVLMPLWLYARGELTGMVVASANQEKAINLLSDLQAQFTANQRFIADYGDLSALGDWRNGYFSTTEGMGFWAFGRGQSPRGIRKGGNRPNFAVVDDVDDKMIVKNTARVRDAVDWILEDLYGALGLLGARLIIAGNRIHKHSILAHVVGDLEHGDPKREGITHIKVFAIEDKKHQKAELHNGQPAWKERYTLKILEDRIKAIGYRASRREYFHEHIDEGLIFQNDWIVWKKTLPRDKYDKIVAYCDPSFKDTKDSDYKAIVVVGRSGKELHILRAWVRQTTITNMVKVFYDIYDTYGDYAQYYIEANMLQDLFMDDFITEGDQRGYQLPIRADKQKKADKFTRIENLSPLFERDLVFFNEAERQNRDMQTLIQQLLSFPEGKDDGPDALHGAASFCQAAYRNSKFNPKMGTFKVSSSRI